MCHKLFASLKKIKNFIESDTFKEDPKHNLTPPNYLANSSSASSSILACFATHQTCRLAVLVIWHTQCPTRGTQNHKWKLSGKRARRPFVILKECFFVIGFKNHKFAAKFLDSLANFRCPKGNERKGTLVTLGFELWCIPVDQTVMHKAGMGMTVGEDKVKGLGMNFLLLMLSVEHSVF